jgi:tryptophanyl-tRNA synthetase
MSKSSPDVQSRIILTDDFSQIRSKVRSAVTDSEIGITYDPINRPGVANLLTILAACTEENPMEVGKRYARKGHGELKADVADAVEQLLKGPREEFRRLRSENAFLSQVASEGAQKATAISDATMQEVKSRIGLV